MKKKTIYTAVKYHTRRFTAFLGFVLLLFLIPAPNVYFQSIPKSSKSQLPDNLTIPDAPPVPVNATRKEPPLTSAEGIYIVDVPSNVTLYEKNASVKLFPASTTKIATALVALDYYKLDDILTAKTIVNDGRTMGLISGERLTFESLLYGTLVHSANDAAYVLAENYPGRIERFVDKMNQKALSLHLDTTHFTNPIGFDDPDHYTTAKDLARLATEALSNKTFAKIVGTKSITVSDVTYTYFHSLSNVNELLGKIAGLSGVKTGFTQSAGEILVSVVHKNSTAVIFVVLKSHDRFGETEKLVDWVFGNFIWKEVSEIIPTIGYQ